MKSDIYKVDLSPLQNLGINKLYIKTNIRWQPTASTQVYKDLDFPCISLSCIHPLRFQKVILQPTRLIKDWPIIGRARWSDGVRRVQDVCLDESCREVLKEPLHV